MITLDETIIDTTAPINKLSDLKNSELSGSIEYYLVKDFLTRIYNSYKESGSNNLILEQSKCFVTYLPYYNMFFITVSEISGRLPLYSLPLQFHTQKGVLSKNIRELNIESFVEESIKYIHKTYISKYKKRISDINKNIIKGDLKSSVSVIYEEEVPAPRHLKDVFKPGANSTFRKNYLFQGVFFGEEYKDLIDATIKKDNISVMDREFELRNTEMEFIYKNICDELWIEVTKNQWKGYDAPVVIAAQLKLINKRVSSIDNVFGRLKSKFKDELQEINLNSLTISKYNIVDSINAIRKFSHVTELYYNLLEEINN